MYELKWPLVGAITDLGLINCAAWLCKEISLA